MSMLAMLMAGHPLQLQAAEWDISTPPGGAVELAIDTQEGTWMSLDLSPDGNTIVFDLLGDIFLIPVQGGQAQPLTAGMAWDMQPRFSPDGSRIAFISDRDGADNLWVMDRDGSNPAQLSREDFRLVHSPAWEPGGQFLAVRKHYTRQRSLGAGEIWMYHLDGGAGVQVVPRRTDQKDINEPAFSPDGRYLYFSEDGTTGENFEYNRDPHGTIYQIKRLDRDSGEVLGLVAGHGGAVRPLPSPDGRQLAFVRRSGRTSALFVKDLASGVESALYGHLDRDNQETWGIHGLYPAMAWLPDSSGLLFWAGGKIRRLDLASRQVTEIPFRVTKTENARPTVRFPTPVAPESFRVKMLRWATVSPDGTRAVYSALGRLYIRDLPAGEPRRLTSQDDHLEYFPAFSPDGQHVVYVSWSDRSLGSIRVVPVKGGRSSVLTPDPGHYVEPSFSPDGQTIIYRKLAGDNVRSPWWGEEPGIYEISARGGQPDFLFRTGVQPRFGSTADEVFVTLVPDRAAQTRDEPDPQRQLLRHVLSTGERQVLASSPWATQFAVSPDGKWLAFTERFNTWLTPMPRTGSSLQVGPEMTALPVTRLSQDAGEHLHWSGDGTRVYWSLGPRLFSHAVDSASQPPAAEAVAPAAPEADREQGLDISFDQPHEAPQGSIAITGVRIITMNGGQVIEDGVVLVQGNRIAAVGPRVEVKIPPRAHTVLAGGMTVMPGIIDVHWHGSQGRDGFVPQQNWYNYATMAFGITTIHDPSNDNSSIFTAKEMQRAGLIVAPRIFTTGRILYGATTDFTAHVDNLDDALSQLRRMQAIGAESVKSYNQPRRNQRQQILEAARQLGMNVVTESGALFQTNMNMLLDGHTGIEHALPVADIYDDVLQLWSQVDVGYTPTLGVAYGGLMGEHYWYQHGEVFNNERLLRFTPPGLVAARATRRMMAPDWDFNHVAAAQAATRLQRAGVSVQLGAHGQREGLAAHWEMWMLAQGGMEAHRILEAATIAGARYLGMDSEIGSIEVGKLADLVVLEQNPLQDIQNTQLVRYVMVNGHLYDARSMDEVGNQPRKREPFYWEQ